jgi:hypothetical protein
MGEPDSFRAKREARMMEIRVLILGAYRARRGYSGDDPEMCLRRLEGLQQHLKETGFIHTRLVKDWPDEGIVTSDVLDIHFLKKSLHYIDTWAEIIAFVFFADGDPISVTREWAHTIESPQDRSSCCLVLREEGVNLGLVRGDIKGKRIRESSFTDDESLKKSGFSGCFTILYDSLSTTQA